MTPPLTRRGVAASAGAFVTNTFAGGSLFADEVFAWVLLIIGFLYHIAENHEY